jgi:hypothetical protein
MKKTTQIALAISALLLTSTANAATLKVEAEAQLNAGERTAVKVEAWDIKGPVGYGLEVKQHLAKDGQSAYGQVVGKVGYALSKVYGFSPGVEAELGVKSEFTTDEFYGVVVRLHRPIGLFNAGVAYRYRDGINSNFVAEKRGSVGLAYPLNPNTEVGVTYHNYFKDTVKDTNAVAISMTRKF